VKGLRRVHFRDLRIRTYQEKSEEAKRRRYKGRMGFRTQKGSPTLIQKKRGKSRRGSRHTTSRRGEHEGGPSKRKRDRRRQAQRFRVKKRRQGKPEPRCHCWGSKGASHSQHLDNVLSFDEKYFYKGKRRESRARNERSGGDKRGATTPASKKSHQFHFNPRRAHSLREKNLARVQTPASIFKFSSSVAGRVRGPYWDRNPE